MKSADSIHSNSRLLLFNIFKTSLAFSFVSSPQPICKSTRIFWKAPTSNASTITASPSTPQHSLHSADTDISVAASDTRSIFFTSTGTARAFTPYTSSLPSSRREISSRIPSAASVTPLFVSSISRSSIDWTSCLPINIAGPVSSPETSRSNTSRLALFADEESAIAGSVKRFAIALANPSTVIRLVSNSLSCSCEQLRIVSLKVRIAFFLLFSSPCSKNQAMQRRAEAEEDEEMAAARSLHAFESNNSVWLSAKSASAKNNTTSLSMPSRSSAPAAAAENDTNAATLQFSDLGCGGEIGQKQNDIVWLEWGPRCGDSVDAEDDAPVLYHLSKRVVRDEVEVEEDEAGGRTRVMPEDKITGSLIRSREIGQMKFSGIFTGSIAGTGAGVFIRLLPDLRVEIIFVDI
ncbi:hypothetical protein V2J09_011308 [Rumex salicifolius]